MKITFFFRSKNIGRVSFRWQTIWMNQNPDLRNRCIKTGGAALYNGTQITVHCSSLLRTKKPPANSVPFLLRYLICYIATCYTGKLCIQLKGGPQLEFWLATAWISILNLKLRTQKPDYHSWKEMNDAQVWGGTRLWITSSSEGCLKSKMMVVWAPSMLNR